VKFYGWRNGEATTMTEDSFINGIFESTLHVEDANDFQSSAHACGAARLSGGKSTGSFKQVRLSLDCPANIGKMRNLRCISNQNIDNSTNFSVDIVKARRLSLSPERFENVLTQVDATARLPKKFTNRYRNTHVRERLTELRDLFDVKWV
jgi:hypothetical protein